LAPLIYTASVGTITAMLVLAGVTLIAPRPSGVPIIAKSIRAVAPVAPARQSTAAGEGIILPKAGRRQA
jgi:hypothetical protein